MMETTEEKQDASLENGREVHLRPSSIQQKTSFGISFIAA